MSYREKENIINIFSGLFITGIFAWSIYQRHLDGRIDLTDDFQLWGKLFLIYAAVTIVARIVIYIVFSIINAIITREEKIPKEDERDKLIKLKAIGIPIIHFRRVFLLQLFYWQSDYRAILFSSCL